MQVGGGTRELFYYPKDVELVTVVGEDVNVGLMTQAGSQVGGGEGSGGGEARGAAAAAGRGTRRHGGDKSEWVGGRVVGELGNGWYQVTCVSLASSAAVADGQHCHTHPRPPPNQTQKRQKTTTTFSATKQHPPSDRPGGRPTWR